MHRKVIGIALVLAAVPVAATEWSLQSFWETPPVFKAPESVIYDHEHETLIVSNVNGSPMAKDGNGSLSLLGLDGVVKTSDWITGLNAPKGMTLYDHILYVSDIDQLLQIDVSKGLVVRRQALEGAKFLNDVTHDSEGNIYVSDMATNTIHRKTCCRLENWLLSPKLENPNGLAVVGDRLYVGSWGVMADDMSTKIPGHMKVVSLNNKTIKDFGASKPVGNMDGVEILPDGQVLATDWIAGSVMTVSSKGRVRQLADLPPGTADLTFIREKNLVIVPLMQDNKIKAYRLIAGK